jgi:hypothetical protein
MGWIAPEKLGDFSYRFLDTKSDRAISEKQEFSRIS